MLCHVCKQSLEGMHDPAVTPRLRSVPQLATRSDRTIFDIEKHVFGHHRTRESLVQSLKQRCLLCVIFEDDGHDSKPANDDYFTTFRLSMYDRSLKLYLMSSGMKEVKVSFLIPLEAAQEDGRLNFELDDTTGGQHARKLIDEWDKNCLAKHLQCGKVKDSAFFPTRMLEFEHVGSPITCRLVLREEVPPNSTYTALSYCWGTSEKQKRTCLLNSTFDEIRTGLPLRSLPKTYVDAIHVTARLGIRYIWIDALCIIQDSPHDWRFEASTMQAVYRNSYLTISADAGTHDNSGLFYSRDLAKVLPTVVNIAYTSCDKPKAFLHDREYKEPQESWPVGNVTTKRGWCLQERLLPSRVLHFGSQQVFWECHEQHASETMPLSLSYDHFGPIRKRTRLWKRLIGESHFDDTGDPYVDLRSEWYDTLSVYSSCQLTRASDKLVAISGLANDLKSALNTLRPDVQHTYLAGLWAGDLRYGLCWYLKGFGRRSAVYRAPSWSPMSLDGFTKWDVSQVEDRFIWHVSNMDFTAVTHCIDGLDTGEVTGGQLELRGPWTTIQTVTTKTTGGVLNARRLAYFQYMDPSSALETPLIVEADATVFYDTTDDVAEQAFCVPIYTRPWWGSSWCFCCIVLVPARDRSLRHRRIGLVAGTFDTDEIAQTFFSRIEKRSVTVI